MSIKLGSDKRLADGRVGVPASRDQERVGFIVRNILPIVLLAYTGVVIITALASESGVYDESITLVQGRMVAQGYTTHVDFWSFYPPLTYYLNAAAFSVFGQTILAQRLLQAGFYALLIVLAYRFLRGQFAVKPLVAVGTTFLVTAAVGANFTSPPFIGYALSVFALFTFFATHCARTARFWPTIAIAGILVGLALTARVNFGAYAAAVIFLDLCLMRFTVSDKDIAKQVTIVSVLPALVTFFFSAVLTWLGVYILMCGPHLGAAVRQSIIFPQRQVMGSRFIPLQFTAVMVGGIMFPGSWFSLRLTASRVDVLKKVLIPLSCALLVLLLAWSERGNSRVASSVAAGEIALILLLHIFVFRLRRAELSLLLFFACVLHYFLSRADDYHWPLLSPAVALLVPYLLVAASERQAGSARVHRIRRGATVLVASLLALLWLIPPVRNGHIKQGLKLILRGGVTERVSDSDRILGSTFLPASWSSVYPNQDELNALRFIRVRTKPNDAVFVGVDDHSHPFSVDVRAYWLLDRHIGTNYYIFDPDLTSRDAIQSAMIRALTANRVRWALIEHDPPMDDSFRHNNLRGSKRLDSFLSTNFVEVARFGRFGVLNAITH